MQRLKRLLLGIRNCPQISQISADYGKEEILSVSLKICENLRNLRTIFLLAAACLLACSACPAAADAQGANLVPNWNFGDPANPLANWRVDFPYQGSYVKNVGYVSINPGVRDGDARAAQLDLPKGVAENEGGKVETAFIKIDAGASYRASVDVMTADLAAKLSVDVYALDPTPPGAPNLDRIPAQGGLPALVKCYIARFEDPPAKSTVWTTMKRDFTVPAKVTIAGRPAPPLYAAVKAFGLSTWVGGSGKVYFSKFTLVQTKPAPASHGTLP